jgi:hypothetical protein
MNRYGEGFCGKGLQVLIVRRDISNTPLEWTGHHEQPATPPQVPCLPLRGSVSEPIVETLVLSSNPVLQSMTPLRIASSGGAAAVFAIR